MKKLQVRRNKQLTCTTIIILFICLYQISNNIPGVSCVPEYISNFGNFTDQLIHILETSEPTEHR